MDNLVSIIKLGIYAFFAWLGILVESFGILIILMCIDSAIGAVKAVRMGREFSFSKLLWGFVLKLCFLVIPLVVALLGKNLGYTNAPMAVNVVISVLSVSEGYSILGNLYSAKNRVEVKKIDFISMLLKSLRMALMNFFKRTIKKIERAGGCEIK